MHRDQHGRLWQGPFSFDPGSITAHAPRSGGVYQILHAAPKGGGLRVAYVGIATGDTIHGRLRKHCSGKGNWALGRLGDPSSFRFVFYVCDAESAKQIEAHTVTWAKPPFNVRPEYRNLIPSIAVH